LTGGIGVHYSKVGTRLSSVEEEVVGGYCVAVEKRSTARECC